MIYTAQQTQNIVITGGPGMGKTSIITHLTAQGYHCIPEVGRMIIIEQMRTQGNKLPWVDPLAFAMEMLGQATADYKKRVSQPAGGFTFFDRGIPDIMGYLSICGIAIPPALEEACHNLPYFNKVFITPPWEEIYVNDAERKQSFSEAIDTYEAMKRVYSNLGYTLIEIPKLSIAKRVQFIVSALQ
ncbi:AAA family ATPase [Sphingobacterium tabacisoli]|uniref:AAA family ATPase n=1 Tax=Sphingobacterium tabacisoli TaxID=2044855 RepID=A0ABW5L5J5_9SPHI|nr:AAA family ATPase [Sphingobacterium tabacisoli]